MSETEIDIMSAGRFEKMIEYLLTLRDQCALVEQKNTVGLDEDIRVMWPGPLKRIQKDVDRELYNRGLVVTSDSIILDHCASWVNLTAQCPTKDNKSPLQVWE